MNMEKEIKETADRVRRIETRLTSYLVKQGEAVNGQEPPVWHPVEECVVIASVDTLLSKCMNVVPADMSGDVYIRTKDFKYVATIHIGGEK